MDDNVVSILLVPAPVHRDALLGDGPCGARVPTLVEYDDGWLDEQIPGGDRALVLAHDGKVVREGLDRWWHVARDTSLAQGRRFPYRHWTEWATIEELRATDFSPWGRVVLLDADGREVAGG